MESHKQNNSPENGGADFQPQGGNNRMLLRIIIGLAVAIVGLGVWFIIASTSQKKQLEEAIALKEQAELDMAQQSLQEDYDALNNEFAIFENSRQMMLDDSVKAALTQKYETARLQIEKLNQELKNQKSKSAAEIKSSRMRFRLCAIFCVIM